MNATADYQFCDLKTFQTTYKSVHGYLSLIVCVFGSVANVLNVCVLTTKQMRWPTNFILTALAIADLMVMLEYIPFVSHEYLDAKGRSFCSHYTYKWAVFTVFHALFTQVFHFISCCLTVILAVWRYIALTYPQNNKIWCSPRRTIHTILFTYLVCPLVCLPVFLSLKVQPVTKACDENHHMLPKDHQTPSFNETIFVVMYTSNQSSKIVSFWVYGVVIKLVPCILLTLLSWKLISVLLETKRRRKNLLNGSTSAKKLEKEQQTDRTTRMLLAVLLMFLVTEFPQAILGLLSAVIGEIFERECYVSLGEHGASCGKCVVRST